MAIKTHAFTLPAAASSSSRSKVLSDVLRKQATDYGPIRHPMQGFDMLAKTALAAHLQRKEDKKQEKLDFDVQQTFDDAMRAYTGSPAETTNGIEWKAQAPDPQRAAQIISKVDKGLSYQMSKAYADQARATIEAEAERKREAETWELQRQKKHADALELAAAKTKGSKRAAMLQVADAYKQAMVRAGKDISDAQALRWAKSSVNDTPQETWTKIYMSNRRDMTMDEDQARTMADEITSYVHGEGFAQPAVPQPERQIDLSPVGAAKAATSPARSSTEVIVPIPPERGAPAPRRRPAREIDGPTQPIPRDATGKVNARRLKTDQVYEAADGTRWRWDGQNFTEVT